MTDYVQKLEQEIAEKQAALAEMQASIGELETALRVLKRLRGQTVAALGNGIPRKNDVSVAESEPQRATQTNERKTAGQLAEEILFERGPMHYKEIAEEAMRRGFRSRQSPDPEAPIRTIMVFLYRHPDTFESLGKGRFRLKAK